MDLFYDGDVEGVTFIIVVSGGMARHTVFGEPSQAVGPMLVHTDPQCLGGTS